MEKRLLLAFLLSFLVLSIWSIITPPQKHSYQNTKFSQPIDKKEVVNKEKLTANSPENTQASLPSTQDILFTEEFATLENEKVSLVFSNKGGALKSPTIKEYNYTLPITSIFGITNFDNAQFRIADKGDDRIAYVFKGQGYTVTKRYQLLEGEYLLKAEIEINNFSKEFRMEKFLINGFTLDNTRLDNNSNKNNLAEMLREYSICYDQQIFRKRNALQFSSSEQRQQLGEVHWVGFRDRYFCAIIKPLYKSGEFGIAPINSKILNIYFKANPEEVSQGKSVFNQALIFIGPQDLNLLKKYKLNFEDIVDFHVGGFFDIMAFGTTDIIAKGLLNYLNLLHKIMPNWGACIIIFALTIFGITYPLTAKSMVSMKKMQTVQPEIKKLQEKYKSNPQRLNKEMAEFFKENKINPLGGCLPVVFQMPIFMALYQVLWRSVKFKGANFLWIKDLSEPDRLFKFPTEVPFLGTHFNLLPVLYVLIMLLNQKFSSKNMIATTPDQVFQQKFMGIFMSIFLGFIFYNFASGLTLYFTVFYLLTTLMQWKMSKQIKVI